MNDLLSYKGFSGSVEYSAEDECLVGEVLFIEGKIAYCGESVSEIKAVFVQAIDEYIEMCASEGIDPQKPFKGSFNVRVGEYLHRQVAIEARKRKVSLNTLVVQALEEKLEPKAMHHHTHFHEEVVVTKLVTNEFDFHSRRSGITMQGSSKEGALCH
ncbi:type II toxin-antitoxin system HicB family antitoxin [Chromobacterium rhizoryzae]|uniref:Type II toxin-antitoxin system HicB family antitoxin n=1 Tax=Chromobacterium rhizoryzae TaxID=1778675 RepID=A0AAD0W8X0_9NEIS|nr:type II toxin-antitoxin system HicB family antitoxin [Chromobacterium rhizoryzae]AXT47755.1 type II toxin-antitoxin system HicB family antitoxin [Chromobacterium rhizoryzae]